MSGGPVDEEDDERKGEKEEAVVTVKVGKVSESGGEERVGGKPRPQVSTHTQDACH